jgi:hypothetical protein
MVQQLLLPTALLSLVYLPSSALFVSKAISLVSTLQHLGEPIDLFLPGHHLGLLVRLLLLLIMEEGSTLARFKE